VKRQSSRARAAASSGWRARVRVAASVALALTLVPVFVRCAAAAAAAEAAEPQRRVLLVIDQPDDPFAPRIRAELLGLGLAVLTVEPWRTGVPVGPLETAARSQKAVAAIRMVASRKGVEVWMADEVSGRSLLRQLVVDESEAGPNQGLVALQTAELLRTSLLSDAGPSPRPPADPGDGSPKPDIPPRTDVIAPAPPPAGIQGGVQAAVGSLFGLGGSGAAIQGWLSLHRSLGQRWGLAVDLSAPIQSATLSGPEGSAHLGAMLAGAALFARFEAPATGLYGSAGAGAALMRVAFQGETSEPLRAVSGSSYAGAAYVRADGGFEIIRGQRLGLRLGLRGIVGLTGVTVTFAGNETAPWGPLFGAGLLVIDLSWR
jgi:hypothetical protein